MSELIINMPRSCNRHDLVSHASVQDAQRDFQIKFLKEVGLKPHHYVLDIGCGTLLGGLPVVEYLEDGHYFGIEVRERVLKEARKELQEAGLEDKKPTLLLTSDISELVIDQQFDFITAWSVLFHMTDEILYDTFKFMSSHLAEDGAFYSNIKIGKPSKRHQREWQGFPSLWRRPAAYEKMCPQNDLTYSELGRMDEAGQVTVWREENAQRLIKITKIQPEVVLDTKTFKYRLHSGQTFWARKLKRTGVFQGGHFKAIKTYVKDYSLALDIGANLGMHSMLFSTVFDKVVGFEPHIRTYNQALHHFKINDINNCVIHNVALGEVTETKSLFVPRKAANDGKSRIVDTNPKRHKIKVRTLDEYALSPSFIKIDTEGFELFVLKGGVETLKRSKPVVIAEARSDDLLTKPYGYTSKDIFEFMEVLGYKQQETTREDVVFVHKDRTDV